MPSSVDICNEALSHLGDSATVSSLIPPEGSAQAENCARFYSSSLAALLELHAWSFATGRAVLAAVTNPSSTWAYAYAQPINTLNILAVLDPLAADDYSASARSKINVQTSNFDLQTSYFGGAYTPQDFATESDANGNIIILTNQVNAVLRYTRLVTDTTKFSPLFSVTLGWFIAANLAGPVLKGSSGRDAATSCLKQAFFWLAKAVTSDASQRQSNPQQQVGWLNAR